jgi:tetratricopeptide (TPR) repeat protein
MRRASRQREVAWAAGWPARAVAVLAVLCSGAAATAQIPTAASIEQQIEESQLEAAASALEIYDGIHGGTAEAFYLHSRLLFFLGEYEEALEHAEQAVLVSGGDEGLYVWHRNLVASTFEVMRDFAHYRTADGRFIISYDPRSADEVLLPLAEETLARAYAEIGFDFGYWPQEPVRVEIYPRTSTLAAVSSLTEEAIENSGTIALCKYNRLMITSPRALVRGYGWRDTLAHEYVHLVIQHLTGTRVPIWLHEGLAKFEERRWRGFAERELPPSNEDLLARRIEENDLISFEQMHPSMALLPTQEDSGTAFAEVYTVVEYLFEQHGVEGLRGLVWAIRDGATAERAVEQVTGVPFAEFVAQWEVYLREREYRRLPSDFVSSLVFMPEDAADAPPDELAGIAQEEARNFMRLGQLLRARGRFEASVVEYRKAESLVGRGNPVWQNYLARALLDMGRAEEVVDALQQAVAYYPSYYLSFLNLGEAHLALAQPEAARDLLVEAAGINPFDPEVHRQLARAYGALGDAAGAERHRRFAERTRR